MPEKWFHELLFRQAIQSKMVALGLGKLEFIKHYQEADRNMGQFRIKNAVFDFLMKTASGVPVCIEVKRCADEATIAQVLRYRRILRSVGKPNAYHAIITVQLTPEFLDSYKDLVELGLGVRLYQIVVKEGSFYLERIRVEGEIGEVVLERREETEETGKEAVDPGGENQEKEEAEENCY